jgi:hypothetical protein
MRRIISSLPLAVLLLLGSVSLTGCIVTSPRPMHRDRVVVTRGDRVWVPAHWGPHHVWVEGHWRYR